MSRLGMWQHIQGLLSRLVDKVQSQGAFCPICGHQSPATEWNTPEQVDYIRRVSLNHVQRRVGAALRRDAQQFNRAQKPGFLNIKLSAQPGAPMIVLPIQAIEAMRQEAECEECQCRYAAIGTVFFCPACGHNSVTVMFYQTVAHVCGIVANLHEMSAALNPIVGCDMANDTLRVVLETSLTKLASAFQVYSEAMFDKLTSSGSIKRRKNVFQNLHESSGLWRQLTGSGYEDLLTQEEWRKLNRIFQQRHIIAHRDGIVDQEYVDKTSDRSYSVGQRLVISPNNLLQLCATLEKLGSSISALAK